MQGVVEETMTYRTPKWLGRTDVLERLCLGLHKEAYP